MAPTDGLSVGPLAPASPFEANELGLAQVFPPGPSLARTRRTKIQPPVVTTEVRRSTRSTRFDGFRVPQISDVRAPLSKVKPRQVPLAAASSSTAAAPQAPPPTPLHIMQDIGINRCAVPPSELTDDALLAPVDSVAPEDHSMDAGEDSSSME